MKKNFYWFDYRNSANSELNYNKIVFTFEENKITTSTLLLELNKELLDTQLYFHTYSYYQSDIGALNVPPMYRGRLIVHRELGSLLLESDSDFLLDMRFVSKIYNSPCNGYFLSANSQMVQDNYYEPDNEKSYNFFFDNLTGYAEIDNDYTYISLYLKKGVFLSNKFVLTLKQLDISIDYEVST